MQIIKIKNNTYLVGGYNTKHVHEEEKRFDDICAINNFSTVHQKVFHDSEFSNIHIGTFDFAKIHSYKQKVAGDNELA